MNLRVFMLLATSVSLTASTYTKTNPTYKRRYNDGCDDAITNDPLIDFEDDMAAPTEPTDTEEEGDAPSLAALGR